MLDPRTVMVAIPCYDGKVMSETAGVLQSCSDLFMGLSYPTECSHVSLVRNIIAGQFLASPFEWLVCIDSDIAFKRRDLELLLQPCDLSQDYAEPHSIEPNNLPPRPSRLVLAQSTSKERLDNKAVAAADMLVCAEYVYKNDDLRPVRFGMGFVRIHRSVFETLQELKFDGGSTVEVRRDLLDKLRAFVVDPEVETGYGPPKEMAQVARQLIETAQDSAGQSRLWQCSHKGRLYHDYFPTGAVISQYVPTAEWRGEDHGFFTLCHLAGIIPRIETRTRLLHIGRKAYPYLGPDVGGGQ